jgi:hypothetical protein
MATQAQTVQEGYNEFKKELKIIYASYTFLLQIPLIRNKTRQKKAVNPLKNEGEDKEEGKTNNYKRKIYDK